MILTEKEIRQAVLISLLDDDEVIKEFKLGAISTGDMTKGARCDFSDIPKEFFSYFKAISDGNRSYLIELIDKDIEKLDKDPEFDPTSFYNTVFVERFPFIPEFAENRFKTGKFQVYDRAMKAFTMAQLRKDTGATINSQEQELVNEIYVPVWGDGPEVLETKAKARRAAFETMKKAAGEAFTESPEAQQIRKTPVQNNAIENLREMVKRNPDLRDSRGRLVREELATLDQKIERQGIEIQ